MQQNLIDNMSNSYFQFKKFTIRHDKCAMKVGMDSVLLGAWAPLRGTSALDIGCGTGILAIMLASRAAVSVHAIDIDASAVEQTLENAASTPWKEQITGETADIRTWNGKQSFDTIISNPPFYKEQTTSPDKARLIARSTQSLSYNDLVKSVVRLLSPTGVFSVILPSSAEMDMRGIAVEYGLHLVQSLTVTTVEGKAPKRILMSFSPENSSFSERKMRLCIRDSQGEFTEEYKALVGPYYLHL